MIKLGALVFICLWFSVPASADPCGDRMAQVQTEVKGLALEQRTHVTKDFDAFYLVKPGTAQRVMVSCGPNVLTVDADWDKGTPPRAYRDLVRSIGRALGFGDDDLSAALEKCLNEAGADNDEDEGQEGVETARAQITCSNNVGRTEISIAKPQ
jgi:hypothetical protein